MKWLDWNKRIVFRLKDAGLSNRACATVSSRLFHYPIDSDEIARVWGIMADENWPRRMNSRHKSDFTGPADERIDNIVSCLLHYIDLRRAGHKPSQTEYAIENEGVPRRIRPTAEHRSYIGSSSSTCADWGG